MHLRKNELAMLPAIIAASSSILLAVSCVNDEYDLSKDIDTSLSIQGDISAPIGSTEPIVIGKFLDIDEENQIISADPSTGDYSLLINAENPISEPIVIEKVDISTDDMFEEGGYEVYCNMKDEFASRYPGVDHSSLTATDINMLPDGPEATDITIDKDVSTITDVVKEIRSVTVDSPVHLLFSSVSVADDTPAPVTIQKGFTIAFPKYITFSLYNESQDDYELVDGHILKFLRDMDVDGGGMVVSLMMETVDIEGVERDTDGQQGFVGDRLIVRQSIVISDLLATVDGSRYETLPDRTRMSITIEAEKNMDIRSATAVLDPEMEIETPDPITIGELPEFLSGENAVLDVYNPVIRLNVVNGSPASAYVLAKVCGLDGDGNVISGSDIQIGSLDPSSPEFILVSPGATEIFISGRGVTMPEPPSGNNQSQNIICQDLPDLLRVIPASISIYDIDIVIDNEGDEVSGYADSDYRVLTFPTGTDGRTDDLEYAMYVDYTVDIPLSFGPELHIEYPYDISGLNETFNSEASEGGEGGSGMNISLREASIKMTFVSTLPIDMEVTASPIDANGKVLELEGLDVTLTAADGSVATVAAGALGQETSSPMVINIVADQESLKQLDGFRLNIIGSCKNGELAGKPLNSNQYVKINDISVRINGGVEL